MNDGIYTWRGYSALPEGSHPFTDTPRARIRDLWGVISMGAVMLSMVATGVFLKRRAKEGHHEYKG